MKQDLKTFIISCIGCKLKIQLEKAKRKVFNRCLKQEWPRGQMGLAHQPCYALFLNGSAWLEYFIEL